jgi:branched-subunit amino acid aminotransferase/4-amino-4-deoxychorismate lyase
VIDRHPQGRAVSGGAVVPCEALVLAWTDPVAQWGLGVFETIAVDDAAPRHLDEHLKRLTASALKLGVPLPATAELTRAVDTVALGAARPRAWLKIVVSRSGQWAVFAGARDPEDVGRAVSAVVLTPRRHRLDPLSGLKSISYAASILGLEEARRRGADEGLWLNERGHVIEACTGNVFTLRGRAVVSPSVRDGARDGVTRAHAIDALRRLGFSVRLSKVRIATLRGADEVFLTSSLRGVRPVVRIDGRNVRSGEPGPIARRLAEMLGAGRVPHDSIENGGSRQGA